MVHEDAICWDRVILPIRFRYMNPEDLTFWSKQVLWERRIMSELGRFVTYHLCCVYGLRESARDRLAVRIPVNFKNFEVSQGFRL